MIFWLRNLVNTSGTSLLLSSFPKYTLLALRESLVVEGQKPLLSLLVVHSDSFLMALWIASIHRNNHRLSCKLLISLLWWCCSTLVLQNASPWVASPVDLIDEAEWVIFDLCTLFDLWVVFKLFLAMCCGSRSLNCNRHCVALSWIHAALISRFIFQTFDSHYFKIKDEYFIRYTSYISIYNDRISRKTINKILID